MDIIEFDRKLNDTVITIEKLSESRRDSELCFSGQCNTVKESFWGFRIRCYLRNGGLKQYHRSTNNLTVMETLLIGRRKGQNNWQNAGLKVRGHGDSESKMRKGTESRQRSAFNYSSHRVEMPTVHLTVTARTDDVSDFCGQVVT